MARRRNSTTTARFETELEVDVAVEAFHALPEAEQVSAWPALQKRIAAFIRRTWALPPRDTLSVAETLYRRPESHRKTKIFRTSPPPSGYDPAADD